jgi:hypothetical protein
MLDRAISGAGAVADGADRAVRQLLGRMGRRYTATRPGSLLVVAILLGLAGLLVVAGLEATDPEEPIAVGPAIAASAGDLGDRTYARISGSVDAAYVETYRDDNGNLSRDEGETGFAWYYWIVDPGLRAGVTVRSTRPPSEVYTYTGTGRVVADPHLPTGDRRDLEQEANAAGIEVAADRVIDATRQGGSGEARLDLAAGLPAVGSNVLLDGPRLGSWADACGFDGDRDGRCDPDEQDRYEIVMLDPTTRHAIRVLVRDIPEFTGVTMTGLLRRDERAADDARSTDGLDFDGFDLSVSDRFVLYDGEGPGRATLAFVAAAVALGLAGVILVGLAGGYLVYRGGDRLPEPAATLASGEQIPLRASGVLRTVQGPEHVREAPAALARVPLAAVRPEPLRPRALDGSVDAAGPVHAAGPANADEPAIAAAVDATGPVHAAAPRTTLVVERVGGRQGLEVGLGYVTRVSAGSALDVRGPRPALRLGTDTGPLVLTFDTTEDRDRAAAVILDETGLGPDGKPPRMHGRE